MAKKNLLDNLTVKNATCPKGKLHMDFSDGGNLFHRRYADGRKAWIVRLYKNGRGYARGVGSYPTVSLKEARKSRDYYKNLWAKGIEPSVAKQKVKHLPNKKVKGKKIIPHKLHVLFLVPMHISMDSFLNPDSNSRSYKKDDGKAYNSLATDLPLGPLSMSAYLKKFIDIDVKLVDFNVELNLISDFNYNDYYEYCKKFLKELDFKPDFICISSLFSPSFDNFMDCGKASKKIWPKSLVLGGGNIPTNDSKYIYDTLNCDFFDGLCIGEGEKPLLELLIADDKKKHLEKEMCWATQKKLKSPFPFISKHNFIENLDEIPFYDYGLCDMDRHGLNPAAPIDLKFEDGVNDGQEHAFHIMTSRGCPFVCTFCAAHRTHGRTMRYHSVERVRDDLRKLQDLYGATKIIFQDDHLMGDKNRVYRILEIVGKLKLQSLYQNGLTLYALDLPMLQAFHNAGVRHLMLPVESGNERVLKELMKKPLKKHISERVAKDCRDLGIYTNANCIIGMPGETKADIKDGLKNLKRVKANWFNIGIASPVIGSEMHELAQEKGYISKNTMGADFHKAVIQTEDWTPAYIQEMEYIFNLELNFIYNNDIEYGEYELALRGFMNVLRVRKDHAFACYFAAVCNIKLGNKKEFEKHLKLFEKYATFPLWEKYCTEYNLTTDQLKSIGNNNKELTLNISKFDGMDPHGAVKFGP